MSASNTARRTRRTRHYCFKLEHLYRLGGDIVQHELIVTTPGQWAARPESDDPSWQVAVDTAPLVIATRLTV